MSDLVFGLGITGVGMGLVFALLGLLWGALVVLGRLDAVLPAEEEEEKATPEAEGGAARLDAPELDPDLLAAIAIAVGQHAALLRMQAAPEQRTTQPGSQIYASRWLAAGRTRQTRVYKTRRR